MSDYLNNIVMRSLNLATVVQPRVPQLFEEASAPAPLPDASEQIVFNAPDELPRVSVAPTVQQTQILTHRAEETAAGEIEQRMQSPFSVPEPGPTPEPREVVPASLVPAATPIARSPETPVPTASMIQADPEQAAASTIGPLWQNSAVMPPEQNPLTTQHAPIQPQLSPAMPPPSPRINATPPPLPIRISIGRVDVRAIMPAGPAKAAVPTRSKPALSLESYLKQREEGKR
jgi:hypothetical protein